MSCITITYLHYKVCLLFEVWQKWVKFLQSSVNLRTIIFKSRFLQENRYWVRAPFKAAFKMGSLVSLHFFPCVIHQSKMYSKKVQSVPIRQGRLSIWIYKKEMFSPERLQLLSSYLLQLLYFSRSITCVQRYDCPFEEKYY